MLPNMTLLAPCDATEMNIMLDYAYTKKTPVAIRYPKGKAEISQLDNYHPSIDESPYIEIKKGSDLLLIVIGTFINEAKQAIKVLKEKNINAGLLYLRVLKPLALDSLKKIILKYKSVVVIEENVFSGSVAQDICYITTTGNDKIDFASINLPDKFIEHDSRNNILKELGFSSEGISNTAIKLFKQSNFKK
jgi:1-deoxy-D-xylulose-5-phosphate synthase